ncbi:MAG: hypothetical protein ABWU14_01290 [Limnospira maxima]
MLAIGKLFGRGQKSDYFLEFDEAKGTTAEPSPTVAPKAEAPKVEAPKAEAPKADKPEKTKKSVAKKSPEAAKADVPATPAPAAVAKVAPSSAPLNGGMNKTPEGMTFATDYLLPKSTATRRRPGPNMNMFRDMARQMSSK